MKKINERFSTSCTSIVLDRQLQMKTKCTYNNWLELTENALCKFVCLDVRIRLFLNLKVMCAACFRQLSHAVK